MGLEIDFKEEDFSRLLLENKGVLRLTGMLTTKDGNLVVLIEGSNMDVKLEYPIDMKAEFAGLLQADYSREDLTEFFKSFEKALDECLRETKVIIEATQKL